MRAAYLEGKEIESNTEDEGQRDEEEEKEGKKEKVKENKGNFG